MKKQVITVLITLLVVAVVETGVFFIYKDYFLGNKEETKTEEKESDKRFKGNGIFTIDNFDSFLVFKNDEYYLHLKSDCLGEHTTKEFYDVEDNTITLFNDGGYFDDPAILEIISNDELKIKETVDVLPMKCFNEAGTTYKRIDMPSKKLSAEEKEELADIIGFYEVGYTDTRLYLNDDKTYFFHYNNCDEEYQFVGNYEYKDNVVTLLGSASKLDRDDDVTLTRNENGELYFNGKLGCIFSGDNHSELFKKW